MTADDLANYTLPSDHELLIVPRPTMVPGRCIASLADEDKLGFLDTGQVPADIDPRVYLSVTYILTTASKLGMIPAEIAADLAAENARLDAELTEALQALNAVKTIENEGFRRKTRPGRPASVEPVA